MASCKLLAHRTFTEQCKEVIAKYPSLESAVVTTLQQIVSNPAYGKAMRDLPKRLQNIVRRAYVGGNNGHRLIYLYVSKSKLILPVYLSPEPRRDFDYDEVPWLDLCEEVFEDFKSENYDAFQTD